MKKSLTEQLQQGDRDVQLPAEIMVRGEPLRCTQMLRLLPRKRAVMKAQWRGQQVLVKLMPNTASGKRNVRRELSGYRILKAANIVTPTLQLTARSDDGSHVLLFQFVAHAQPLGELWQQQRQRSALAELILRVIAQLHRNHCLQTDPHLNNFLRVGAQIYVIDAASIKRRANIPYRNWRRNNLAFFLAHFKPAQRAILLATLATHYPTAATDPKLDRAIAHAWRVRKARSLKKCFRECSDFSTRKNWRQNAVWKRAAQCAELDSFVNAPDAYLATGALLKDGNSATVVRVQMNGQWVVIKRNNITNLRRWLRYCLRTARCRISWRNAHLLEINGIATPAPIACVEKRWGPFRLRGYYVSAFQDAPTAAKKYAAQLPTAQELGWFKSLFAALSEAQLCHGDLKASNLLVTEHGIALVDLDAMKECAAATKRNACIKKDRRRFLKNWRSQPQLGELFAGVLADL